MIPNDSISNRSLALGIQAVALLAFMIGFLSPVRAQEDSIDGLPRSEQFFWRPTCYRHLLKARTAWVKRHPEFKTAKVFRDSSGDPMFTFEKGSIKYSIEIRSSINDKDTDWHNQEPAETDTLSLRKTLSVRAAEIEVEDTSSELAQQFAATVKPFADVCLQLSCETEKTCKVKGRK